MEVSCGHGGGAGYVTRYLHPKRMVGVDQNPKAIEFCRRHHSVEGLSFVQGDAEALQFDDHSIDAVINVEASHCYGDMAQFLREVFRLLRPGGYFLFADFRPQTGKEVLLAQLAQSGLDIIKQADITENVLKALAANDHEKSTLIQQVVPKILRVPFKQFAGVKGSKIYRAFEAGNMVYLSYVLRKPSP